jgi:signal transduction histidine kinase
MTIPKGRSLFLSFGLLAFALVVNAVVAYRATVRMIENQRWVDHTQEVLLNVAELFSALQDTETGQRGYLISGSDAFLGPYQESLGRIDSQMAVLRRLTADNPRQQERLGRLEPHIRQRLRILEENLETRRRSGLGAVAEDSLLQGQREMLAVRQLIQEITGEERRLLAVRNEDSRDSGRQALLTLTVANLLLLGLTVLSFLLVRRYLVERARTEEALRASRDELEIRVQERTADLVRSNDQLSLLTRELERSNRELQDFAFVASHDLQEPLRKIQAFGDRLGSKHGAALGASGLDYLQRMQAAAQRMHVLINDLLTFSRVTSKAQPFAPVDLGQVAREVLTDLEVRLQETGGEVELAELPSLDADGLQMRQLFQNLIGNALKFHRPGVPPRVEVRAAAEEREGRPFWLLSFMDNGIGFDMKYLDRIFTPFQRLHGRGEYEGTGMGLAVCRRIVERHQGEITAESVPGEGTRFLVLLPARQQ